MGPPQQQLSTTSPDPNGPKIGSKKSAMEDEDDLRIVMMKELCPKCSPILSPAQVGAVGCPHHHCRGRGSGQQGDGTQVLGHIASGQPEGAQPGVAVTSVLCNVSDDSVEEIDIVLVFLTKF